MDAARPQVDPEELLANAAWLHALARSLVADDHRADDVVQQTLAAAVEHPPGGDVPLRPWLARVARNFSIKALRSEGRRAQHESQAPAPPPTASPTESVARAETFRDVVNAVLALEPIYRDVVLARFFDGLEMAAVAARLGVPEETARTRLKRAIGMLRDRLDRKYGDRKAWAVLLVAGRRAVPTAAGVGGGIVAWKMAAAAAVAFAVAGGWYALRTDEAGDDASPRETAALAGGTTAANVAQRHPSSRVRAASSADPASATSSAGQHAPASLVVRVTDADTHQPIAGASVVFHNPDETATTDAGGVARFEGPHVQPWIVTADARAHLPQSETADADATTLDLALRPAATLEFRTVDAAGVVVPNVPFEYGILGDPGFGTNATFADGRQWFPVLPNVVMVVRVGSSPSHHAKTSAAVWTGPPGAPPVTVTLRVVPEARLVGVVRDADGSPDGDAAVRAMPSGANPATFDRTRGGLEGWIDDEGRYAITGLVRGRSYDVVASDSRHAQQRWAPSVVATNVVVPEGESEITRDFALRHNAQLVVRLVGSNGELAPDGRVVVVRANGIESVEPRSPGVFVWPKFPPGEASLMAMAPGQSPCSRVVDVPADATTEVTLELGRAGPPIAGVVVDETGAAVVGTKVNVRIAVSPAGGAVASVATSDTTGRFRGALLGDGRIVLDAEAPGHRALRGLELPGPSEDVRIVLRRAATVSFTLTADEDAPPIRTIRLLFADSPHVDTVYTDDLDTVRVEKEPRGETEMRVYVERFATVVRRVKLGAGVRDDLGEIRLVVPTPLRGRVVDASGRPVAHASVRLDMGDDDLKLATVRTDADGAFTAQLAPPSGLLPLRVEAPGFLTLRTSVTIDGDAPVTLRLARGGVVWGEVVDASGAPVPWASVAVTGANGAKTATDADECGLFGARVAAGRCTVTVGGVTTSAEVADGSESRVRLVVAAR